MRKPIYDEATKECKRRYIGDKRTCFIPGPAAALSKNIACTSLLIAAWRALGARWLEAAGGQILIRLPMMSNMIENAIYVPQQPPALINRLPGPSGVTLATEPRICLFLTADTEVNTDLRALLLVVKRY